MRPPGLRWARIVLGLAALLAGPGAGPPEVVRVRVPSSKVAAWFPAGTDLQVLPPDRFEELVRAASVRGPEPRSPRVLRADHAARWESGVLVGLSEFEVEVPAGSPPSLALLDPWSPALTGEGAGSGRARATEDGRLGLKVAGFEPGGVAIGWRLRARPGSEGRAFSVALPDLDLASMTLDLPSGLVPDVDPGAAIGPGPGREPGRSTWRFPAARGRVNLRLRDRLEDEDRSRSPRLWLEGPTRVDLAASPANWKAEWTLDESPGAPRLLTIELDPGLELVDVSGPRVASFREEPAGPKTRVAIRLGGEGTGPSPLTIRAITRAPAEGAWPIPTARPVDAAWTGGRVSVRLDAGRVLVACAERSGRRLAPRSGELSAPGSLVFEPDGRPGPVAELTFRRPSAEATVLVRGLLRVGDDVPRVVVALTWAVEKGRLLVHAADLPPGWSADRVTSSSGEPVPWHADDLPGGGSRVQMVPPAPDGEARSLTLLLAASSPGAGATGPVDLPRVRPGPSSGRLVDEVWVAPAATGLALRPILARGVAWIDPPEPAEGIWAAEDLAGSLAWRWLVDDAEARADRARSSEAPPADVRLDASIARGRIRLDWSIAVEADGDRPATAIPFQLDGPIEGPARWRATGPGGVSAEVLALDEPRADRLGFPKSGPAFAIDLPAPARGRSEWKLRLEVPWPGAGRVPLLRLPPTTRTRGQVAVRVEEAARARVTPEGLVAIDPDDRLEDEEEGGRRVAMFGYGGPGGRLMVETSPGEPGPTGGLVRQACLTTQVHPGAGLRHRLTLRIAADAAREVVLTLPPGASLDRVRREGQPVAPIPDGASFRLPLPGPQPGRSSSSFILEYRTDAPTGLRLEPSSLVPVCSLPCLSFAWEVVAPEPWSVRGATSGLTETDPRPSRSWASTLLGLPLAGPALSARRPSPADRDAFLAGLDKAFPGPVEGESSLGDWLVKLDSGPAPVVVDRLALLSSGLGPASRLGPVGSVDATLQAAGLAAEPVEGVVLVTTRAELPEVRRDPAATASAWGPVLRQASAAGSDESDRFQSASRWRGEPTPRALSAGEVPERMPGPVGWRTRRLVAPGWPSAGDSITLVDEHRDSAQGWMAAAVVLGLGVGVRRRPALARALGLGVATAAIGIAIACRWPEPASWMTGALRGLLASMAFWLGRSLRPAPEARGPGPVDRPARRRVEALGAAGLALLAWAVVGSIATAGGPDAPSPILALFPFDGPPDPSAKPDRVVMRLVDHERLRRLARPEVPPVVGRASVVSAVHRVTREGGGFAAVEGRYEVEVEGPGPASWSLPIGPGRDLSATVDGRATPIAISGDGLLARVPIGEAGVHSVRFRRLAPLSAFGPGGERCRLPIGRCAFARVEVPPDPRGHRAEVAESAGPLEARSGGLEGVIGPVDSLDVRWSAPDRPPTASPRGPVEATMLWDARPVGDFLRVRLGHSDPEGASTIRLALEPGLLVRGYSIPDVVGVRLEGTPERPEWVARVDPPWPRDLPIEVDFWRPPAPGPGPRRLPRVETLDARRFSGVVGFRRPGDWSGRLEAAEGAEALPESSFARSWGALPEDGLTLAGSVRFGHAPSLAVVTGPVPKFRVVVPKVSVELQPGRLEATIEAVLSDRQGRSFELEVGLPADFRVLRVEAGGMADWQRVARDRLRLQFDGSEAADRPIRIQGYLPAATESAMVESRTYRAAIPWPRWGDAVVEAGSLAVSGPGRFQWEPAEGVSPMPATDAGPGESGPASRSTFRVENPGVLGPIRWGSPRAKVAASVRSDLMIGPDSVAWTAVVDSEITGGPAESLQWNLSSEWAEAAELEVDGRPTRPTVDRRGETTTWKIQPGSPIWGRARLVIRSRLPARVGVPFAFPEVSPMALPGRGSLGRYDLAIANVSGRPIEVVPSPGLQAVDASRYRSDESPAPPGSIRWAYRVTGERWSLRVTVPIGDDPGAGPGPARSRVARARLSASLGAGGEAWGLARYDLQPRPGPSIAVDLPPTADVPWAAVDGVVAPVTRDGPRRWLVSIRDREARRVEVCWHLPPTPGAASGSVAWPSTGPADVPTLIRLSSPRSVEVASRLAGFRRISAVDWEVEDAEALARRAVAAMADLDRGSRPRRAEVARDLVDFELIDRAARRPRGGPAGPNATHEFRLRAARALVEEASRAAGLDDLVAEARGRVGLAPTLADEEPDDRADPAEPARVRRIGEGHEFRSAGSGPPGEIAWASRPVASRWRSPGPWWVVAFGLALGAASGRLVARPIRGPARAGLAASLTLLVVLMLFEPWGAALLLASLGLGRASG